MIEPALKDNAFLASVRDANPDPKRLHLWWLGQSGFLLKWADRHLLFDPYLSDSLTQKYASTDKPHVRMTERVVDPSRLDFIDVATSTHNHTDHLDAETLKPLMNVNGELQLVIPEANRKFVCDRLDCELSWPVGLDAGRSVTVATFEIHAVPAAHEHIGQDDVGRCHYLGFVVHCGDWTVYHSGDTMMYDGMAETLKPFGVDVALLPINGRNPERRVAGNMNGEEAARLGKEIDAGLVIPCHYEMFEFNTESPELFTKTCETIGQAYTVLKAGERLTL